MLKLLLEYSFLHCGVYCENLQHLFCAENYIALLLKLLYNYFYAF